MGLSLPPRPAPPQTRVDLVGALVAAAAAALVLLVALVLELSPPHALAAVLLVTVPVLGGVALPIVVSRARAHRDGTLGWFAAGLAVSVAAATLHTLSFPTVLPDGGPLGTSTAGISLLYLVMHAALPAGVLAAACGVPGRLRRWFVVVGCGLALACALDLVPAPVLVRPDGPVLRRCSWALTCSWGWFAAAAVVLWVRRVGRPSPPCAGWAGIALSLCAYDVLLNAVSGRNASPPSGGRASHCGSRPMPCSPQARSAPCSPSCVASSSTPTANSTAATSGCAARSPSPTASWTAPSGSAAQSRPRTSAAW